VLPAIAAAVFVLTKKRAECEKAQMSLHKKHDNRDVSMTEKRRYCVSIVNCREAAVTEQTLEKLPRLRRKRA
jgi:hypothetical protein